MEIINRVPTIDLHGEISSMVEVLVNEFINDCIKMHYHEGVIIHGKSTNILTKEVHRVLKVNKSVKSYKLNNWNLGETLVEFK